MTFAGDWNPSTTVVWPNYWPNYQPFTPWVQPDNYYTNHITISDPMLAARVTEMEKENAELRGKVDTLEKMLAALIGGSK